MGLSGRLPAAPSPSRGRERDSVGETPGRAARIAEVQNSLEQSRGVIFFSAAYLLALSSTILRIISRSPAM